MFRTIFALTFTVLWCIPWMVVVSTLLLLFPKLRGSDFSCMCARRWWAPWLFWCGAQQHELLGTENCPSGPAVYLSNHQGIADMPLIYCLPVTLRFVAKTPIKYVPFLGWYMLADRHVFIDRGNRKQAMASLRMAGEQIRSGINVVMFPEGTRTPDGKVLPFKKGPFRLAMEAGVPIVPMALEGARNAWERGTLSVKPGKLTLKVGKPIPTAGLTSADRDDLIRRTRAAIIELHREIGGAGGDGPDIAREGLQGRED